MTIKEIEQFAHKLGFDGKMHDIIIGALYMDLNRKMYLGPTVIYCTEDKNCVYITPKLKIKQNAMPNGKYRYETVPREERITSNMTVIYTRYELTDDVAIKQAILKLKEQWKNELNKLKIADIEKDFI